MTSLVLNNWALVKGNGNTLTDSYHCQNCFPSLLKRELLKKKKSFPFRVDPFSEGTGVHEGKQEVTKVVSLVKQLKVFLNNITVWVLIRSILERHLSVPAAYILWRSGENPLRKHAYTNI